jgi:hypothetical protein
MAGNNKVNNCHDGKFYVMHTFLRLIGFPGALIPQKPTRIHIYDETLHNQRKKTVSCRIIH